MEVFRKECLKLGTCWWVEPSEKDSQAKEFLKRGSKAFWDDGLRGEYGGPKLNDAIATPGWPGSFASSSRECAGLSDAIRVVTLGIRNRVVSCGGNRFSVVVGSFRWASLRLRLSLNWSTCAAPMQVARSPLPTIRARTMD